MFGINITNYVIVKIKGVRWSGVWTIHEGREIMVWAVVSQFESVNL